MEPTYQIQLDDYHMGEITGFESSAACKDRDIWENGHWEGHCDDDAAHKTVQPGMTVLTQYIDDEGNLVDEDDSVKTRWSLVGTLSQLRQAYQELLAALSEPAWHWYATGGDDYCYDYWPNTMGLAAEFRDQLIELAVKDNWDTIYNTQYLADDLCNIYWLTRMRYVAINGSTRRNDEGAFVDAEGKPAESRLDVDNYFEGDILSSEDFGPRPDWIEF